MTDPNRSPAIQRPYSIASIINDPYRGQCKFPPAAESDDAARACAGAIPLIQRLEFRYARHIMISPLASRLGLIFFNKEAHG